MLVFMTNGKEVFDFNMFGGARVTCLHMFVGTQHTGSSEASSVLSMSNSLWTIWSWTYLTK